MKKAFSMSVIWPIVLVLFGSVFVWAGCASSGNNRDVEDSNGAIVNVYGDSELPESAYESVREVTSVACKEDVYSSSPTREDGVSKLKLRAEQEGANALVNVTCHREKSTAECSAPLQCRGDAVRVASVDALPQVAERLRADQFGDSEVRRGTGWVVAPGMVVTSFRLIEGRSGYEISFRDTTLSAELVASDETHNLALLRPAHSSPLPLPLPLSTKSANTGERVFTLGYSRFETVGDVLKTSTGIISAQSGALGDPRVYRTTISFPFEAGGAPLLNRQGHVVGVLFSAQNSQEFSQSRPASSSFSYAVKTESLRQLQAGVEDLPDSKNTETVRHQAVRDKGSLSALIERVRSSVLVVTAR